MFGRATGVLLLVLVPIIPSVADQPRQHHFTFYTGNVPPWVFTTPYGYPYYQIGGYYPGYGWGAYPQPYGWVATPSPYPGGVDYKLAPLAGPYSQFSYGYQQPYAYPTSPAWPSYYGVPSAAADPVLNEALRENERRWNQPLPEKPIAPLANKNLKPTTPEQQVEAAKLQARGDAQLQQQQYLQASQRYREALKADPNRAEAEFRLGFALVGLNRFDDAVAAFKRGVALEPEYPSSGVTLEEIYGDTQQLAISSFEHAVAAWVREDIRDPDRLFLMGVLLHFDQNQTADRSEPFFEAAYRLAGKGAHLLAFLDQPAPQRQARPVQEPREQPRVESLQDSPEAPPAEPETPTAPPPEPNDAELGGGAGATGEDGTGSPPSPM